MVFQETVAIFSAAWWTSIAIALTFIIVFLKLPSHFSFARKKIYSKFIGTIILINLIIENGYGLYLGVWNIKHFLPLHFCGISGILASILMFKYSNKMAIVLFYWGIIGGCYALMTPEFDLGTSGYFFYGYIISHASIILVSLYTILYQGFRPSRNSWMKTFFFTQLVAICIGLVNWYLESNYMYLLSPPIAQNPMIFGKWPWYLFIFEILAIIHFYMLYSSFHKIKSGISILQKTRIIQPFYNGTKSK